MFPILPITNCPIRPKEMLLSLKIGLVLHLCPILNTEKEADHEQAPTLLSRLWERVRNNSWLNLSSTELQIRQDISLWGQMHPKLKHQERLEVKHQGWVRLLEVSVPRIAKAKWAYRADLKPISSTLSRTESSASIWKAALTWLLVLTNTTDNNHLPAAG